MQLKKIINDSLKVALSLLLGGLILYWMYRDFDFRQVEHVLLHEMNWTWMLLSFPFGILAQAFRGWRWHLTLEPVSSGRLISRNDTYFSISTGTFNTEDTIITVHSYMGS